MRYLVMDMYNSGFFQPLVLSQSDDDLGSSFKVFNAVRRYKEEMDANGILTCPLAFYHSLTDEELETWLKLTNKMFVTFLP